MELFLTKTHLIEELNNKDFKNVPSLYENIKSLESNKDILYNANIIIFQSSSINHNQRLVLLNKINNLSKKAGIIFCVAHNLTLLIKLNRELGKIRKSEMNDLDLINHLEDLYRHFELQKQVKQNEEENKSPRILYSKYVSD